MRHRGEVGGDVVKFSIVTCHSLQPELRFTKDEKPLRIGGRELRDLDGGGVDGVQGGVGVVVL